MKKLTTLTIALAVTLLFAGLSYAGNMDMNHGDMKKGEAMAPHEAMKTMEHNIKLMKDDVAAMKDEAGRSAAMDAMGKHMMDMHHGMAAMEAHAKTSGDAAMQQRMKDVNMGMMETMKGMGMMKKDMGKAMPMMNGGLDKMQSAVDHMKDMM